MEKNRNLIIERGLSFEEVIAAIGQSLLLDIMEHPNKKKYPDQKMFIVNINQYAYLVPFIKEEKNSLFLKTIIPSRKATKHYLGDKDHD